MNKPDDEAVEGVTSLEEVEGRRVELVTLMQSANFPFDLLTCLALVLWGKVLQDQGIEITVVPMAGPHPGEKIH
jgi:hypothetical protein